MKRQLLFIIILLFSSCKSDKVHRKSASEAPKINKIISKQNILIVSSTNGSLSKLYFQKENTEFVISPDSTKLLVNSRILSTLQISKLFQLNDKGEIDSLMTRNLSAEIWDSVTLKYNIPKDEINFPRTNASFSNADGSELKVTAQGKTELGQDINENITIKIDISTHNNK